MDCSLLAAPQECLVPHSNHTVNCTPPCPGECKLVDTDSMHRVAVLPTHMTLAQASVPSPSLEPFVPAFPHSLFPHSIFPHSLESPKLCVAERPASLQATPPYFHKFAPLPATLRERNYCSTCVKQAAVIFKTIINAKQVSATYLIPFQRSPPPTTLA